MYVPSRTWRSGTLRHCLRPRFQHHRRDQERHLCPKRKIHVQSAGHGATRRWGVALDRRLRPDRLPRWHVFISHGRRRSQTQLPALPESNLPAPGHELRQQQVQRRHRQHQIPAGLDEE